MDGLFCICFYLYVETVPREKGAVASVLFYRLTSSPKNHDSKFIILLESIHVSRSFKNFIARILFNQSVSCFVFHKREVVLDITTSETFSSSNYSSYLPYYMIVARGKVWYGSLDGTCGWVLEIGSFVFLEVWKRLDSVTKRGFSRQWPAKKRPNLELAVPKFDKSQAIAAP